MLKYKDVDRVHVQRLGGVGTCISIHYKVLRYPVEIGVMSS